MLTLSLPSVARATVQPPSTGPTTVDVFAAWAVASERGEWTGTWTEPDGPLEIGGTYQAQWRKVEGRWLIQAELFVPPTILESHGLTERDLAEETSCMTS